MPGIHFKQNLPVGVVLSTIELLGKAGAGRGVHPPGIAVGNNDTIEAPLIQLGEEFPGICREFQAIVGQFSRVHPGFADGCCPDLVVVALDTEIKVAIFEVREGQH